MLHTQKLHTPRCQCSTAGLLGGTCTYTCTCRLALALAWKGTSPATWSATEADTCIYVQSGGKPCGASSCIIATICARPTHPLAQTARMEAAGGTTHPPQGQCLHAPGQGASLLAECVSSACSTWTAQRSICPDKGPPAAAVCPLPLPPPPSRHHGPKPTDHTRN
jgi:hypothetical protein